MRRRTTRTIALAAAGAAALALVITPTAALAANSATVPGSKPVWVDRAHALGRAAGTAPVDARVHLAPRGGIAALERAAYAISAKHGDAQFLSPAQYRARYAPTAATRTAVEHYLRGFGLTATTSGADGDLVVVRGTVAQAQRAFATPIARFRHDGQSVQAPTRAVSMPRAIAASVLAVTGLDTTVRRVKPLDLPAGTRTGRPCSAFYGQVPAVAKADGTPLPRFRGKVLPYAPCGYVGSQFRSAYEGRTALTGSGVTVALLGVYASPTIAADANTYAVRHGDGAYRPGQLTQNLPDGINDPIEECGDPGDYYPEESLDVEAVHAMARDANIRYYGVKGCEDGDFAQVYRRVLDENRAQIVSTSYGDLETEFTPTELAVYTVLFARGALQGVSFMFSSGDFGDETVTAGTKTVNFWASDPLVTAVGGTSDGIDASGRLALQTGWGSRTAALSADGRTWQDQGFMYGAGGGTSQYFPRPSYQAGVVGGAKRAVPDIGLDADPNTGMLVGETQVFPNGTFYDGFRVGGTSLASPLFAGMTALAVQAAGHRVGFLNPTIYSERSAFTDVLPGPRDPGVVRANYVNDLDPSGGVEYLVRTFDEDSSLQTTKGYDLVTGVGSPNPRWLTAFR